LRPVSLPPAELVKQRLADDIEAPIGLVAEDVGPGAASRFNERR
jgi:hypothetical protein